MINKEFNSITSPQLGLFDSSSLNNIDYFPQTDVLLNKILYGIKLCEIKDKYFFAEYWTNKQRQGNSIHDVSYRACFKSELPNFFIKRLTKPGDYVYDPFMGRGTTLVEASILNRNCIGNDINPVSKILTEPRLNPPLLHNIKTRLDSINLRNTVNVANEELDMFFSEKTLIQIVNLKNYFKNKKNTDIVDNWIKMVATNRLTGHSKGFFSVYTMPPNQAVSRKSQININRKRNQVPQDKDIKEIILKKSKQLLKDITYNKQKVDYTLLSNPAHETPEISDNKINLIVTSPPFLDIVNYSQDNWLRLWFNDIDEKEYSSKLTLCKTVEQWSDEMAKAFKEFKRILQDKGFIAFEVGEVRNKSVELDKYVVKIGINLGFNHIGTLINTQNFTKTSNIWGIKNNTMGTNTNRIVLFQK